MGFSLRLRVRLSWGLGANVRVSSNCDETPGETPDIWKNWSNTRPPNPSDQNTIYDVWVEREQSYGLMVNKVKKWDTPSSLKQNKWFLLFLQVFYGWYSKIRVFETESSERGRKWRQDACYEASFLLFANARGVGTVLTAKCPAPRIILYNMPGGDARGWNWLAHKTSVSIDKSWMFSYYL